MDDMGNEIKSIECCIAALNGKAPEDGGQWVLETLRAMYEAPYKGRGLGIGSHRTGRISWGGRREWAFFVEDLKSPLSWLHVLLVLFDGANLNEKEMFNYAQQITKDNIIYNHVLEHILENLAAQDAVEEVKKHIPFFATSNVYADNGNDVIGQKSEEALGWRILLRYYAQKADTDNFFKIFKLCEPGKDRPDLERIKRVLVQSMMRAHGIEAVIKLLGHRNIGERYTQDALEVLADDGEYVKLKELFARYPQLTQPNKETELNILAAAYEKAATQGLVLDEAEFDALFERARDVNPKLKWGDTRLRDWVLFNLGLASKNNKERYMRCRKAIKNNWVKRELSDLA